MIKKFLILVIILSLFAGTGGAVMWDLKNIVTGAQMVPSGAPWFADSAKMYFGTDKDGYIWFNPSSGKVEMTGIAVTYTGGLAITAGNDLTVAAAGDSVFDFHLGTGTTDTTTGTNTLNGDTVIAGAKSFTTGTGAIALNGAMTIAATKGITKTAGIGDFDFSAGSGTFKTSYGANQLSGDTLVANGKNFGMTGSGTFGTGTGAVSLNGDVSIASGKSITAAGGASNLDYALSSGFFKTPTGQTTLNGAVSVGSGLDIVAVGGASDIDYSLSSGVLKTPTGTNTIGGDVVLSKGKTLTVAAGGGSGAGTFDFSGSTGAFTTSSGANTLSGSTSISGAGTFTSGTGAVTLKGDTSIDVTKKFTKSTTIDRTLTKTANYTIADTDPDVIFIGAITALADTYITLPTAHDNIGRKIEIDIVGDPGAFNVILKGEGAEAINGVNTKTNSDEYSSIVVRSFDTGWVEVGTPIGTWS